MQSDESQLIVKRFFEALYCLKDSRAIRGKQTFTAKYGINRWNLNMLEKNPSSGVFQPAWLTYLVRDYDVSAEWLLTGRGAIMKKKSKLHVNVIT